MLEGMTNIHACVGNTITWKDGVNMWAKRRATFFAVDSDENIGRVG